MSPPACTEQGTRSHRQPKVCGHDLGLVQIAKKSIIEKLELEWTLKIIKFQPLAS